MRKDCRRKGILHNRRGHTFGRILRLKQSLIEIRLKGGRLLLQRQLLIHLSKLPQLLLTHLNLSRLRRLFDEAATSGTPPQSP